MNMLNQPLMLKAYFRKLLLLLLLLMIWQSPGLPEWRKVNFMTDP